jgi:hypothetical protein
MTKAPAPLKRLALAFALLAAPAQAAPARLDSDSEIDAFAARVEAYANASLVRWTVLAPTHAAAQAKIDAIVAKLPADDRGLASRLIPQESPDAKGASAYVSPQIGASGSGSCSWQVWVTDPALPTADDRVAAVPLAPRDRLPVSAQATFRVGHFGLVQSKLYAFDETDAGAVRDLAAAPTDIPVPKDGGEDHVVLATARNAAPFLEDVKAALGASQGERRDLGQQYALRGKLYAVRESQLGAARGIGANIEAVPSSMISAKTAKVAAAEPSAKRDEALMETCLFALTPSP